MEAAGFGDCRPSPGEDRPRRRCISRNVLSFARCRLKGDSMKTWFPFSHWCACRSPECPRRRRRRRLHRLRRRQFRAGSMRNTPNGKPTPHYPAPRGSWIPRCSPCSSATKTKSDAEVGAMDSDPVCRCRTGTCSRLRRTRHVSGSDAASADVAISDDGHVEKIHFALVWLARLAHP